MFNSILSHHLLYPHLNFLLCTNLNNGVAPNICVCALSPLFSLDGSSRPGKDGSMQLLVGTGGGGAAGQPAGGVSSILRRQTGTLAGETC